MPGSKHAERLAPVAIVAVLLSTLSFATDAQTQASRPSEALAAQAEAARVSGRADDAIALYEKALIARPYWAEGWWRLATLRYDRDEYAKAAAAFEKTTSLDPKAGTAWVMLGLCEFKLGKHDAALAHIQKGRKLGTSADPQFRHVMLFHEAELLLQKAEFERAQETLNVLSADAVDERDLILKLGLAVLRIRPADLREEDAVERQLVERAGRAEHLAARKRFEEAQRAYQQLADDFPKLRNVQYALGRYFIATRQPDNAVAAFLREIENSPDHVPARLGIAAVKADTDPGAALEYAEAAVRLNPRIPLGHYLLGKLLLGTSQIDRAISELETAERSVRDDPGVYYALGRAYARAGRTQDAERARATFQRLMQERERADR